VPLESVPVSLGPILGLNGHDENLLERIEDRIELQVSHRPGDREPQLVPVQRLFLVLLVVHAVFNGDLRLED